MSLVAYDDSSSEEEKEEEEGKEVSPSLEAPTQHPSQPNQNSMMTSSNQGSNAAPRPLPSLDELPDAAFLLSSPSNPSPQNTSRKREPNGNTIQPPQSKVPRGGQSTLVHARNVHGRGPTTTMLVPPQLSGRSNVVTEDIEKLFVNRRRNSTG